MEEHLLLTDLVVEVEEVGRASARNSIFREGASERELVEHRLVAAEEAVLLHLRAAIILRYDVAYVEDLAVVVYVSEVAILGWAGE